MTVLVEDLGGWKTRVVVGGRRAMRGSPLTGGGQLVGWGETGKITREFFDTLWEVLPEVPEPVSASVPDEQPATPTAELERLAALHAAGSLTDDEFKAAKARLLHT